MKFFDLTLSQTTNFRLFQIKKFADNNFKFGDIGRRFEGVENPVEKRRNYSFMSDFFFSHSVLKDSYCRHIKKMGFIWEMFKEVHKLI